MRLIHRFFIAALLFAPCTTIADSGDEMHLQSAFLFAKKKDWPNALAHAKAGHSDVLTKYFFWEYLKDPEADASFKEIAAFIDANPQWPDQELLERRAEASLLSDNPSDAVLDAWYEKHPPKTTLGKKRQIKDKNQLHELIREAWIRDDYTRAAESRMLLNYRDVLRPEDHTKRADRLLWEGKETEAKRLFLYVLPTKRLVFEARIALRNDSSRALKALSKVPAAARGDAGLLYERMRYRARKSDKDGVREILLQAPAKVPYPEKWWTYRERQIRDAVRENRLNVAEHLLARHAQEAGSASEKEARWLKAWIALEYRNNPSAAYDIFEALYDELETPGSKARAAYWAARAAEKMKLPSTAWYQDASKFNTTFYGQLALLELEQQPKLTIHADDSEASSEDKKQFKGRELVKLVQELARARQTNLAGRFILFMVDRAKSAKESVLAAQLGRDINRIDIGVRASKKALRDGVVALQSGYPIIRVEDAAGLERSFVLALVRQESEFFADAVSGSGALGLMQLLPSTAREVAHKAGLLPFHPEKLFEAGYNLVLGSRYLSGLVTRFEGSYVLATASYNAGPGRVRQWIASSGYPGKSLHATVNWIEGIPLSETRNYVQHVMGNMQVYRYILAGGKPTDLTLGKDLLRGAQ